MAQSLASTCNHIAQPRHRLFTSGSLLHLFAVARQRHQLARLDAERLADIGLCPDQARTEARRHFWDAPRHWK